MLQNGPRHEESAGKAKRERFTHRPKPAIVDGYDGCMSAQGGLMADTMHALVYHGTNDLRLEERPLPQIRDPRDAIVKVELSSICASDLHIRNGAVPRALPGTVLGHEFVGEVVATGSEVRKVRPGQRVAANVETFCGTCWFCRQGYVNNCRHGGWELGCRIDGCQTEYVRVPFADNGLDPIPDSLSYQDVLLVGDVLASGYFGAELAAIRPGDSVAVLGAGPVGLCAMQCARLFGPAQIIAVDILPSRLQLAQERGYADLGIDAAADDVEARILDATGGLGADAVIECAGGHDTFQTAWKVARPNATVAVVAMYEEAQSLPLHLMYGKNLTFRTGGVDATHSAELIRLIERGRIDTNPLITHSLPLNKILEGYRIFEQRQDDCIKCAITPWRR